MSKIRIVLKSGYVQEIECKSFKVTKHFSKVQKLEWEDAKPDIMQLDCDEIAAIFEL